MLKEGWVKFFRIQNTAGVSQEKGIAAISQTTETNGDQFSNIKKFNNNNNIIIIKLFSTSILLVPSNPSVLKP